MKKSYLNRIILWSIERFPLVQIITAFLTFTIVCISLAGVNFSVIARGTWIVLSLLLLLRVLDEHKDFVSDSVAHPERLLQKGVLSLNDLKWLASFFCIVSLLLVLSFEVNLPIVFSLCALIAWIYLMYKEFFLKEWLSQKLFLYSVSHLFVSPFIIYFCACLVGTQNSQTIFYTMAVSFFSAFSYEVARKIKGKNEVNLLESNYVNSYGMLGPLILFVTVSILAVYSSTFLIQMDTFKLGFYIFSGCYVVATSCLFYFKPQKNMRKLNEASAATIGLVSFIIPLLKLFYA